MSGSDFLMPLRGQHAVRTGQEQRADPCSVFAALPQLCRSLLRLRPAGQTALHLASHAGLNNAVWWLSDNMGRQLVDAQDHLGEKGSMPPRGTEIRLRC